MKKIIKMFNWINTWLIKNKYKSITKRFEVLPLASDVWQIMGKVISFETIRGSDYHTKVTDISLVVLFTYDQYKMLVNHMNMRGNFIYRIINSDEKLIVSWEGFIKECPIYKEFAGLVIDDVLTICSKPIVL